MKKSGLLLLLVTVTIAGLQAQHIKDSNILISMNQQIDDHVVAQNVKVLEKLYADDFVFSHGSGKIEGKQSWLVSVGKGNFISRKHDSVTAELHPDLAVLRGKLSVEKKNKDKTDRYHLKYIRVYAYRNKEWQMVSHVTTHEYHEP